VTPASRPALEVRVPETLAGMRVDRVVALLGDLPRSAVSELVDAGAVQLDGRTVTSRSRTVCGGEKLRVEVGTDRVAVLRPDPGVAFAVVYEDRDLIVVDKPAGVVVHHGAGQRSGTLVEGLVARFPDIVHATASDGDATRPGIVHRLDKGTSGLLVVARTPSAYAALARQFRTHRAGREYRALVHGVVESDAGTIEAPIGRSARQPTRMAVSVRGRPARTHYQVERRFTDAGFTLVRAVLDTGRTHQVRVHMAAIGHPVVGDEPYGRRLPAARLPATRHPMTRGRLFLHAARLSVEHPRHGPMTWDSPLPPDLDEVLDALSG
jgi:23S rRNA pseudouridine1911/1915/1917 synthase